MEFFSAVEFQIWPWTGSLNQRTNDARLAAVDRAIGLNPAWQCAVAKRKAAADTQEKKLVRNSPVVSHPDVPLDPNKARLELRAPSVNHIECFG
jgi:hypothetical protein